jgi:3',5'-cyclic AMP phosphodiesterase CpdA
MSIRPPAFSCAVVVMLTFALGCGRVVLDPHEDAGTIGDGPDGGGSDGGGADASGFELLGAPLIFTPTARGFGLNVVLRKGSPSALRARAHDETLTTTTWIDLGPATTPAADIAQWVASGLQPGRRYTYQICVGGDFSAEFTCDALLYTGSAATKAPPGTAFTFAAMADTHIEPRDPVPPGDTVGNDQFSSMELTLRDVAADITAADPDFIVNMGDLLDYHLFGFNAPPPDAKWSRLGYLNYRRMMGASLARAAHFPVIGNWDGENGCNSEEEIQRSLTQRLLYAPAPPPGTYPEGGSPNQDYYAFTWGDALFVVLNVMTYTPTCHLLGIDPGLPDDWTLGAAQLAWLEQTLANATSKWRFTFIHHTVGGKAGNDIDSAYGRGGGQAAGIGEQALVHEMLRRHGVQIFFYAHDHVFTDMVVDGIHYTLPGSAGAPWKFTTAETGYTSYWPDSGFGRVRVDPASVTVDFVALGGSVISSYTLR